MSFDGTVTRAVVHELKQTILGGKVTKIYQPSEFELVWTIRSQGQNWKLLLSAHPAFPRFHLTEAQIENPPEPPMFCMLLRKHLEGAIIQAIEQVGMERIVQIDLRTRNELGDEVTRRMVIEIMGRHSNLIFLDPESGTILDAIRRVGPSVSQYRQVLPGLSYVTPPAQNKQDPFAVDKDRFIAGFDYNRGKMDKQLMERFIGIGPLLAREIIHRAGIGSREKLWEAFAEVISMLRQHQYQPQIVQTKEKAHFAVVPLTHLNGEAKTFSTISQCLDAFYWGKAERDRVRQQTQDLIRRLEQEIAKNKKKIEVLTAELAEAEQAEQWKIYGELITAYLYQIQRGASEVTVVNYYDPEQNEITIPLDPSLSPAENAQRYFKKYNKAKETKKWNQEQIRKAKEDISYLESVLVQLEHSNRTEIEQIREELAEQGWIKAQPQTQRKRKKDIPSPAVFTASDGTTILVGKNNKQNDYLTHKLADKHDTWLHTKDIPGSHVVIRSKRVSEQTLYEAAILAAYFSKARESSQVPVDYTLIKYVKKPSGARPGFVIYENQKTLYVTPKEEIVQQLMSNKKLHSN